MAKITYNTITFDSELEVNYYRYLEAQENILRFKYHPKPIPNLVGKRSYTPDFIVQYLDHWEIVETKGYNPYSKMIDDAIHQAMLTKSEDWLRQYIQYNGYYAIDIPVQYKKIKHLKSYGFVDWDFKNPNTISNQRKVKIQELEKELKDLKQFQKDTIRYFSLHNKPKLTLNQKEFIARYLNQFYKED